MLLRKVGHEPTRARYVLMRAPGVIRSLGLDPSSAMARPIPAHSPSARAETDCTRRLARRMGSSFVDPTRGSGWMGPSWVRCTENREATVRGTRGYSLVSAEKAGEGSPSPSPCDASAETAKMTGRWQMARLWAASRPCGSARRGRPRARAAR